MANYETFFQPIEMSAGDAAIELPSELKGVAFELFWDCNEEVRGDLGEGGGGMPSRSARAKEPTNYNCHLIIRYLRFSIQRLPSLCPTLLQNQADLDVGLLLFNNKGLKVRNDAPRHSFIPHPF